MPANAPHQFHNASSEPVRMLCICSPAGQKEFFRELGVPVEFAGLASGLAGIYPVDIKALAGFPADGRLICSITDSSGLA
jgi:hypothetical protein